MKNHRILSGVLILCLTAANLFGCGMAEEEIQSEDSVPNPYAGVVSMEEVPVLDYAVPRLLPNIMVDSRGYSAGETMVAAVKGRELPEEFVLVDVLTGREVYRGNIEETAYRDKSGLYSGYADFSDFQGTGVYYIKCDRIGCSTDFPIKEEQYAALFDEIYKEMLDMCRRQELSPADAVALLEAYEWYAGVFPDEDGDKIPDVLKILCGWISYREENGVDEEDEALYAAFLAKFSYLYQKFDREYATDCIKRASTVLGEAQARGRKTGNAAGSQADLFFALTELYRATGRYTYRTQIAGCKSFFEENDSYLDERSYLHAAMTYIDTRNKVETEMCKNFISSLMERAEETSKGSMVLVHPLAAGNENSADLLKDAVELSCANYIMNNYQYTAVTENFLHYLMGRNLESVCFYDDGEDRGSYLLLLAQLTALHETGKHEKEGL